jgi:class 3 adenylate cyclase
MTSDLRVCISCGEENPRKAKFCMECGTHLPVDLLEELPQEATGGERRVVTVLFADLSGFTSFSERSDVEDVRAIAHETADRLGDIVVRYGGTVDKIIGDCVMAVWGAPATHEDDPERAVRAAVDMRLYAVENAESFGGLALSIGLNTGEAMWAPVGGRHTVLGDTVNTAARLQGAADRGEIYVGEETYSATSDVIVYEVLEPIKAKNKKDPVPAFKAIEVKGAVRRRRASSLPLVGRETERERLWELWERARTEKQPYGALILGSPGLGRRGGVLGGVAGWGAAATVLRGACLPYGEGITYWPIVEMIRQAAGILHDDDHDTVSTKLGALLEGLGCEDLDELRTMAVAIANLIGEPTTPRGTYTATEISRGELHWGLRRIVELAAAIHPMVLVIEDLHWAEPALVELLDYMLHPGGQAALFGIGTARTEFADTGAETLGSRENRRTLVVEALPESSSIEMVRRLVGEGDVPDAVLRQLLEASGGNPLFLEEMIQMWVDAGAGGEGLAQFDIPSGLHALISSRLDRLPPSERRLLCRAAVIGDVFWSGALATLDGGNGAVEDVLGALEERDLLHSHTSTTMTGQREFAFKHGLIREVAYGRLPKGERAVLHEQCGTWIAAIGPNEFAEIIAYHLEEACKLAAEVTRNSYSPPVLAAVNALTLAAKKSEGRQGLHEAVRFYDRALNIAGVRYPETMADLKFQRARMNLALGQLDRAYGELSEAAAAALELGRADIRSFALANLAEAGMALGHFTEARQHLKEAELAATQTDNTRCRIDVAFVRAEMGQLVDGAMEAAERDLREAAELAEESDDHDKLIGAQLRIGLHSWRLGRLADAQESFRSAATLARERGSLQNEATATLFLANILYHLGPRDEAERLARQAVQWLERLNQEHLQAQAEKLLGRIALESDDPAAAQPLFSHALALIPPQPVMEANIQRFLAEARARQGRVIGARAAAAAAAAAATEHDPIAQAYAAVADGCAGVAEASVDAAREGFDRALSLFEQQNMKTDVAETRVTYARALSRLGDVAGATVQVQLARTAFESMDAAASVRHVDELFARMSEGADLFGPLA